MFLVLVRLGMLQQSLTRCLQENEMAILKKLKEHRMKLN